MKGKTEITAALQKLKDACKNLDEKYQEAALEVFQPLEEAIDEHFTPLPGLDRRLGECAFQLAFNYEYRNMVFVHQNAMPKLGNDFPKGYSDIRDLFDGGGAWEEMEKMDGETFAEAFIITEEAGEESEEAEVEPSDEGGDGEETKTVTITHPMIEDWTACVKASRAAILPGVEEIIAYCEQDAATTGMAVYFEEHGGIKSSPTRRETAEHIFITSGYAEVIRAYGLNVRIPSCVSI